MRNLPKEYVILKILLLYFPLGGLSAYSNGTDAKWYDPEAHQRLFDVMKKGLNDVPWHEHSGNVNDKDFADFVVNEFLKLWENK